MLNSLTDTFLRPGYSRWLTSALFIIASVMPVIYFTGYYGIITDHIHTYTLISRILLIALPVIILVIHWLKPAIGISLSFVVIPVIEVLWETAVFPHATRGLNHNYLIFEIIQVILMVSGGILARYSAWMHQDKQLVLYLQWARWILGFFSVMALLTLGILSPELDLAEEILAGYLSVSLVISWIRPRIGSLMLIVGIPVGLFSVYLVYFYSQPDVLLPPGTVSPGGIYTWWDREAFLILVSLLFFATGMIGLARDYLSRSRKVL